MAEEKQNAVPKHLAHKPMYSLPYMEYDGFYVPDTDARWLTVGLSQWAPTDWSVKILRYVNDRWSRQSEELPLHRPIDMVILLTLILLGQQNIAPGTFHNQRNEEHIECHPIPAEYSRDKRIVGTLNEYLQQNTDIKELLQERLETLWRQLGELEKAGWFPKKAQQ